MTALPEPFWDKIDQRPDGCWHWTGSINGAGYGRFGRGQYGSRIAHRLTYLALVGPIPDGLTLDHLCRVRHCVNPDHLDPVTHAENMRRGHWAEATHCANGHPWDKPNMYRDREGKRRCRACKRQRMRELRKASA